MAASLSSSSLQCPPADDPQSIVGQTGRVARATVGAMAPTYDDIDAYLGTLPEAARAVVEEVRRRIHHVVPGAEETISYQMPTMTLDGRRFVHFAGWKQHLSLYPAPAVSADADFEREFAPHRGDKGTATFPNVDPMPYDLI
jgi:uncharacterized protein YdhG (YjbR/CyaY superfamily)